MRSSASAWLRPRRGPGSSGTLRTLAGVLGAWRVAGDVDYELLIACPAGFPADRIVLHGNAKTPGDLQAAMACRVGRIVVDSAGEIARIAALARSRQRVLVRVTPDVDAHVHAAVATGVEDQKFGFSLGSGAAVDAVRRILAQPELELAGLHCHLGSQITGTEPFEVAARKADRAHGRRSRRARRDPARAQHRRRPRHPLRRG